MGFKKFNRSEKTSVLPQEELSEIEKTLARTGKASVADLSEKERKELSKKLDR
jgi:hypothetical protein